jgi:protein-disulfide isomerase
MRRQLVVLVLGLALAGAGACSAPCPPVAPDGAAAGRSGGEPCGDFASAFCAEAGETSDVCLAVATAAEFLPPAACRVALADLDQSLALWREAHGACVALAEAICARVGESSRGCALVRRQVPGFSPAKCRAMVENIDLVVQELECAEREGQPLPAELWRALTDPAAPAFGPADASVVLVAFSDFECPYCGMMATAIEQVRERFAGRSVRVVFRQFPLDRHPNSRLAAAASLEAQAQGRFWEFHDLVFAHQDELGPELLEGLAGQAGLEQTAYRTALREDRWTAAIDADLELGAQACVGGTPTLFLDGARLELDPRDPDALPEALDAALRALEPAAPPAEGTPVEGTPAESGEAPAPPSAP